MGKRQAVSAKLNAKKPSKRQISVRASAAKVLTARASRGGAVTWPALRKLVAWFERNQRILPWRETPTLYRVWISEIMLQQTQVATVLPYFERFVETFPTVESLASADTETVMKAWAGLGYYSRARNLHRAAQEIVRRGGTKRGFPQSRAAWMEIPGVGPYTAGAITSIALGLPEPIVDGNVERVFSRMRRLRRSQGDAQYKENLWELSRLAVTTAHRAGLSSSHLNQAWMELGATLCSPRKPACERCPVSRDCEARTEGEVENFPERKKRREWVEVSERRVALVDFTRGTVYVEKAPPGQWRAGLWDFPAEVSAAVLRKLPKSAELGRIRMKLVVTQHKITRDLDVTAVSSTAPVFRDAPGRWISMADPEVGLGSASKKGIREIRERFA